MYDLSTCTLLQHLLFSIIRNVGHSWKSTIPEPLPINSTEFLYLSTVMACHTNQKDDDGSEQLDMGSTGHQKGQLRFDVSEWNFQHPGMLSAKILGYWGPRVLIFTWHRECSQLNYSAAWVKLVPKSFSKSCWVSIHCDSACQVGMDLTDLGLWQLWWMVPWELPQ